MTLRVEAVHSVILWMTAQYYIVNVFVTCVQCHTGSLLRYYGSALHSTGFNLLCMLSTKVFLYKVIFAGT